MIKSLIRPTLTALRIVQDQILPLCQPLIPWGTTSRVQHNEGLAGDIGARNRFVVIGRVFRAAHTMSEHFKSFLGTADTLHRWKSNFRVGRASVWHTLRGRRRTAKCDRQRRDTIVITSAPVYLARPQEKLACDLDDVLKLTREMSLDLVLVKWYLVEN